jgi:hypothetical protein
MPYADKKTQNKDSLFLFSDEYKYAWEDEWVGMPEFVQENKNPFMSVIIHLKNEDELKILEDFVGKKIDKRKKTRPFVWLSESGKVKDDKVWR